MPKGESEKHGIVRTSRSFGNPSSVKRCLVSLGAPVHEVYLNDPDTGKPIRGSIAPKNLSDEYSTSDLLFWGQGLYRSSATEHHPDRQMLGSEEWDTANNKFQELGQALSKLKKILEPTPSKTLDEKKQARTHEQQKYKALHPIDDKERQRRSLVERKRYHHKKLEGK